MLQRSARLGVRMTWRRRFSSAPPRKFNLAVVGNGRMGKLRMQDIRADPRCTLSHVVEPNAALALRAERDHSPARGAAELRTVLADPSVDAVWISAPTASHLDLISRVAASGKHVAVEKPVAGSLGDVRAAYAAAEEHGVRLLCSFQRRFDDGYRELREAVVRGEIGTVRSVAAVFRDHPVPPVAFLKEGGDIFHDLAVHDVDYICDLLGEYPETVMAAGSSLSTELREANVADQASVWLQFRGGLVAFLDLSRGSSYGYDQRMEVFGTKGRLQVRNRPKTSVVRSTERGVTHAPYEHSFPERFREAYRRELSHFLDVLEAEAGRPAGGSVVPAVTRMQAQMATVLAEAARLSAEAGVPITVGPVDRINFENVDYCHHTKC